MSGAVVRAAVPGDCPLLRGLIQELADYEKMPDGPKISAETLERDGFGEERFFHCQVCQQSWAVKKIFVISEWPAGGGG